jgi:hypothetical protein
MLAQADPGNAEAQALQEAVRDDIQRDLNDARALLEQSVHKGEEKKYRKAAEIILLKALYLDPDNKGAKSLLQSLQPLAVSPDAEPPTEMPGEVPFVAAPPLFESKNQKKRTRPKVPLALGAFVILAGGLLLTLKSRPANPSPLAGPVKQTEPFNALYRRPALAGLEYPPNLAPVKPAADPAQIVRVKTPVETAPAPPFADAISPVDAGKLAVSSATAAEIYKGDRHLGSTPATLQLPVGRQTLEYRHGDLRTVVSHDIKSNATTTATITFQVTVQINARPWAQVFLDGASRRPLGQTPLSSITVPIGGVLVFENPNFASKSYRITENSAAIQVDFP